ncbi:Tn3 family transposase [Streptosporangium roseum]|uniref:Tn3 family transposase n=1 Tax=Streptosporangium roseum TaxID=2001 RepID=UPI003322EDB1
MPGIDLGRIERHWKDILRIIGSIHTGAVRAHDVIRMLSHDGRPTPLGDAIAHYGRIAKTLHILRMADEPGYRRQIKAQANLQVSGMLGGPRAVDVVLALRSARAGGVLVGGCESACGFDQLGAVGGGGEAEA